jgi:hypothetical protein
MTIPDQIRQAVAARIGYQTQGQGFAKVHHSLTLKNALLWAACYDRATVTRRGQFIATKTTKGA